MFLQYVRQTDGADGTVANLDGSAKGWPDSGRDKGVVRYGIAEYGYSVIHD